MSSSAPSPRSVPTARCYAGVTIALAGLALSLLSARLVAQELRHVGPGDIAGNRAAYDSMRKRFVAVDRTGQTWELDGAQWLARPAQAPARSDLDVVFAPQLGKSLVAVAPTVIAPFEMWAYDGVAWAQLAASNAPPARSGAMVAWDPARARLVMFGGVEPWFSSMLDETWTFDGAVWVQMGTMSAPPARAYGMMAFDAARQRLVLFGGYTSAQGWLTDTWEWDGVGWQQVVTANAPTGRGQGAMAYDPVRARCVLYGGLGVSIGSQDELWEYDGVDWTPVPAAAGVIGGRLAHAMAFDERIGEVVVIGGHEPSATGGGSALASWSWNGSRWQAHALLAAAPSLRYGASLIAEPGFGSVILYGGGDTSGRLLDETLRWDGHAWVALPGMGLGGRAHAASCTVPQGAWLFGGMGGTQAIQFFGDTWQWDGFAWSQLANGGGPSPRANTELAYDVGRGRAVLFGGYDTTAHGDTWSFDGVAWQQHTVAVAPSPRFGHGLAYDPVGARVLLFGGLDANFQALTDTWSWDGVRWSQVATATVPSGTGYCVMKFDPLRQGIVMLAGMHLGGPTSGWKFDGADWAPLALGTERPYPYGTQMAVAPGGRGVVASYLGALHQVSVGQAEVVAYGGACGVRAPQLGVRTWPRLGAAFGVECTENDATAPVVFVGAFAPANVGVGGCTLLVAPGLMAAVRPSNAAGFAELAVPVPTWPGLLGLELYFQAASLRGSAPGGFVMSRGLRVAVGD